MMHEVSAGDVGAAEVYPSSAALPLWALNDTTAVCGAVILWSTAKTELVSETETPPVALCEPAGREGSGDARGER